MAGYGRILFDVSLSKRPKANPIHKDLPFTKQRKPPVSSWQSNKSFVIYVLVYHIISYSANIFKQQEI